MSSRARNFWITFVVLFSILNIALLATGRIYYYKALVYNYVNIDDNDLFPVRYIKAGIPEPWNIGNDYNEQVLSDTLNSTLEQYRSVAYLVIRDDSIRYERYWDDYGPNSHSNSFSMAKSYISTLVGIAIDQGLIRSVDDQVCDYLEGFCGMGRDNITIKNLLTMSSGLDWDEGYATLFSGVTRAYYDRDLPGQMYNIEGLNKPGMDFNYMSCNTQLLAMVVEKVSGMHIADFASTYFWKKIGAERDAYWSLDEADGIEKAYCCIYSNARDFARIGKLYLNNGRWNGELVISPGYVKAAISPASLNFGNLKNTRYGYQWWLTSYNEMDIFYARGILGQYVFVVPDINLIFVRLGHTRGEANADGDLQDVKVYISETISLFNKHVH